MKTGQVIGATDRLGGEASERPVQFGEVFATLYQNLGIDVSKVTIPEGHLREVFDNGHRTMELKRAVERLEEVADVGRSAAYEALKLTGRFAALLVRGADGLIGLKPVESEPDSEAK